jgi:predicted ATPase
LVLRGLSRVFTESYASTSAADDYRRALDLCDELEYSPLTVPLTVAVWSYYTVSGDLPAADTVVEGLLRRSTQDEFAFFRPEVEACAAIQHFYGGRFDEAARLIASADTGFAARGADPTVPMWKLPTDPVVAMLSIAAGNSWLIGDDTAADEAIARALERARSLPFPTGPFSECFALVGAVWLAELKRDTTAALAAAASLIELASRHAYLFWQYVGFLRIAVAQGRSGDAARAADDVASAISLWLALGVKAYGPCNLTNLAELRLAAGDLVGAVSAVDEAIALAESTGERFFLAEALRVRGEIAAAAERFDDAISSFRAAGAVASEQGARRLNLRAAVALLTVVPASHRDDSWHEELARAVRGLPNATGPEIDAARRLLHDRPLTAL